MPEKQIQYGIRLSESMLDRADKLAEQMSQPGIMRITRADAIRIAISRGFEQLESEKTTKPARRNEKRNRSPS